MTAPTTSPPATPAAPAARGERAAQERVRFVPERLSLPSGAEAQIVPAPTRDGSLVVPDDAADVGWWDGGAWAGDPFGTTVLAGHINDKRSVGTLAELTDVRAGDVVTVAPAPEQSDDAGADTPAGSATGLEYRVVSSTLVAKDALADDPAVFDQRGPHRLVLITCWGEYTPGEGFDSNLVVVAEPVR